MSTPISVKLYDLSSAARTSRLQPVVEREAELGRLVRLLLRPKHPHVALIGEAGSGKSSLIDALALALYQGHYRPLSAKIYRLDTSAILNLLVNGDSLHDCLEALARAAANLPSATIAVEDIQLLAADDPTRLELTLAILRALTPHAGIRLIITTTTQSYHRLLADDYAASRMFAPLELADPSPEVAIRMIEHNQPRLEQHHHQTIAPEAIELAVQYGRQFGHGRALPDAAIRLLEETGVKVSLDGRDHLTTTDLKAVVAERERLPLADLDATQHDELASLEPALQQAVIGQTPAIRTLTRSLARSALGLGDASRPRGSFLLLGPSGVGKTETAKALARTLFANPQALVRLDMSEYSEPHAAMRLIGSPPGYIGYEAGGQLTGAVAREPYSLVLLDEIEKAHPKLFDLFLQLLDDGRLTDSTGRTVDFTATVVLATSNTGSAEIAAAASAGHDIHSPAFLQTTILPLLLRTYRPEFINRFDAILMYQPLALPQLVALAQRELAILASRLASQGVSFAVSNDTLTTLLQPGLNPLFGARPVKRLIATHFEAPLADRLIHRQLRGPITITGRESWLRPEAVV